MKFSWFLPLFTVLLVSYFFSKTFRIKESQFNVIITFNRYDTQTKLINLVAPLLKDVSLQWEVRYRKTVAEKIPTDFLTLSTESFSTLKLILKKQKFIRRINLEKTYKRVPLNFEEVDAASKRKLLFETPHNRPTDLLNAQTLWDLGFSGKGVKVGVTFFSFLLCLENRQSSKYQK